MVATGNLFDDIPARLAQEEITTLMSATDLRIERIVSAKTVKRRTSRV